MGNQEIIWKDVDGYEGLYQVSNSCLVKRLTTYLQIGKRKVLFNGKIMQQRDNGKGYFRVKLSKDNTSMRVMVHKIIAKSFIENKNNLPVVNHINGDKKDNRIENLEWCTQQENCLHFYKTKGIHWSEERRLFQSKVLNSVPRDKSGKLIKRNSNTQMKS